LMMQVAKHTGDETCLVSNKIILNPRRPIEPSSTVHYAPQRCMDLHPRTAP